MAATAHPPAKAEPAAGFRLPRHVDPESTGWLTSLGIHAALLALLAAATLTLPTRERRLTFATPPMELEEPEESQEFFSSDRELEEIGALSSAGDRQAMSVAYELNEETLVSVERDLLSPEGTASTIEVSADLFQSPDVADSIVVQGIGAVGTTGASGAIDRLTHEIVKSLEQRPTLVVWLFDQSGSLRDERAAIVKRFDRIYEELGVVEAAESPAFRKHEDKPLLTAVVGFGETAQLLIDKPTDRIEDIKAAIRSLEDSDSPVENVFHAIAMAAEEFRTYRLKRQGERHVMFIVFTDEAGDDVEAIDGAVQLCRKYGVTVYVVGRPAAFGREYAYVAWIDPDPNFDQRPQRRAVTLGPESLAPERLKIYFVGQGANDPILDSGFGPFALTRLCYETGGLYFSAHPNRVVGRRVSQRDTNHLTAHFIAFFDPEVMQPYQPDYVTARGYERLLRSNRACAALVEAAQMSWTSPLGDVRLRFPKRDEASLAEALSTAQRAAAILQPKIDQICNVLLSGEADRPQVDRPRWQAGYDLALGRALALQVRTAGYNAALAQAKRGMQFADDGNNTWVLNPDATFANTQLERTAEKATEYLTRVAREHAETPWAYLANQELESPLGWRWDETFTRMPPEEDAGNQGRGRRRPGDPSAPRRPPRRDPPPL